MIRLIVLFAIVVSMKGGGGGGGRGGGGRGGRAIGRAVSRSAKSAGRGMSRVVKGSARKASGRTQERIRQGERDMNRMRANPGQKALIQKAKPAYRDYAASNINRKPDFQDFKKFMSREIGEEEYDAIKDQLKEAFERLVKSAESNNSRRRPDDDEEDDVDEVTNDYNGADEAKSERGRRRSKYE